MKQKNKQTNKHQQNHSPRYFAGFLSTQEVYDVFRHEKDGSFLIRYSSSPGNFALSCLSSDAIKNWRIQVGKKNGMHQFTLEGMTFVSLNDLTHHYTENAIGETGILLKVPFDCSKHPFFVKRKQES